MKDFTKIMSIFLATILLFFFCKLLTLALVHFFLLWYARAVSLDEFSENFEFCDILDFVILYWTFYFSLLGLNSNYCIFNLKNLKTELAVERNKAHQALNHCFVAYKTLREAAIAGNGLAWDRYTNQMQARICPQRDDIVWDNLRKDRRLRYEIFSLPAELFCF